MHSEIHKQAHIFCSGFWLDAFLCSFLKYFFKQLKMNNPCLFFLNNKQKSFWPYSLTERYVLAFFSYLEREKLIVFGWVFGIPIFKKKKSTYEHQFSAKIWQIPDALRLVTNCFYIRNLYDSVLDDWQDLTHTDFLFQWKHCFVSKIIKKEMSN